MKFADIIGQRTCVESLRRAIDGGRVSHAQLFVGQSGSGALALALAYFQYLNCQNRHDGDSCGECVSCRQMQQLTHPDLNMVFPVNKQGKKSGEVVLSDNFLPLWRESVIGSGGYLTPQQWDERLDLGKTLKAAITVKEADEIIRRLSFKSFQSEYKGVLIWLPETMNEEASNKILKILEEPWDKTLFMLVSGSAERLLPTIVSRTQEVSVRGIEAEALDAEAVRLLAAKGQSVSESHLRALVRLAGGDYVRLKELLGEGAASGGGEYFELFKQLMRLSYNDKHLELITWAEDVARLARSAQRQMLVDFVRLLRESYMMNAGLGERSYLWGEELDFCRKFSPFIGNKNIEFILGEIQTAMAQITQNGNSTIVFTHFALSVSKTINKL